MAAATGRPPKGPTIAKLVLALLATGILAAGLAMPYVLGAGLAGNKYANQWLNTTCTVPETKPPQPTTLYANDRQTVIARLFSQDRKIVPLDKVPTYLQDALIATEDRRFYSHHGVDLRGLGRSLVSTTGGDTQGGSTLTMQYVKQLRYYQAGDDLKKQAAAIAQTLERKMEDAKCALDLEGSRHLTKAQILADYLNIAFFGEHSYGIETAANTYFNKSASQLTLGQSALLVGLLRAPSDYDPFLHPAEAKLRRNQVLQNLVEVNKLSQAEADRQKAVGLGLATQAPPRVKEGCANANSTIPNAAFFCDYAVRWLQKTDGLSSSALQTGGLQVVTTLDPKLQKSAQDRIAKAVPASSPMTAVLPAVDPRTGDILAMASSKKYGSKGTSETEQPIFTTNTAFGASTYKLFPLLTALSIGIPKDWKLTTTGNQGTFKPQSCLTSSDVSNGDANVSYRRTETLADATAKSSNTYFVALADNLLQCHLQPIIDMMHALGMHSIDEPGDLPRQTWAQIVTGKQRAQQLVLGSLPTNPLELAGAYATVANGGKYIAPAPILSVTDSAGSALPVKRAAGKQVLAPQVAARAVQILEGDTLGQGTTASVFQKWYANSGSLIAGKTGTNESTKKNQNSSVWFVGMTRELVAASGLINFDSSSAPSSGLPHEKAGQAYGDYAAKVWLAALGDSLQSRTWDWPDPNAISGEIDVPSIARLTPEVARQLLAARQFKMVVLDEREQLLCPSSEPLGTIAYYGPHRAAPGSTISVCVSSGIPQLYVPPVVHTSPRSTTPRGSGNRSTGGTSRSRSRSPSRPVPTAKPSKSRHPKPGGG